MARARLAKLAGDIELALMEPADRGLFGVLKAAWTEHVEKRRSRIQKRAGELDRDRIWEFPEGSKTPTAVKQSEWSGLLRRFRDIYVDVGRIDDGYDHVYISGSATFARWERSNPPPNMKKPVPAALEVADLERRIEGYRRQGLQVPVSLVVALERALRAEDRQIRERKVRYLLWQKEAAAARVEIERQASISREDFEAHRRGVKQILVDVREVCEALQVQEEDRLRRLIAELPDDDVIQRQGRAALDKMKQGRKKSRDFDGAAFRWSQVVYHGWTEPWKKLVSQVKAAQRRHAEKLEEEGAAGGGAAPEQPAAPKPEQPAEAPGPEAKYELALAEDRFTGETQGFLAPVRIKARHRSGKGTAEIVIQYVATAGLEKPTRTLLFASREAGWPEGAGVPLYLLVDEERELHTVKATPLPVDPDWGVHFGLPTSAAFELRLRNAKKVELRIGNFQFEVPADYRQAIAGVAARVLKAAGGG